MKGVAVPNCGGDAWCPTPRRGSTLGEELCPGPEKPKDVDGDAKEKGTVDDDDEKVAGAEPATIPGDTTGGDEPPPEIGCPPGLVVEEEANIDANPNAEGPNMLCDGVA